MKNLIQKCFFLLVFVIAFSYHLIAQSVTGKWYGVGIPVVTGNTNNYLCEFILQQNGKLVSGEFNYYFRNGYFSNKIKGTYDSNTRTLSIKFTPFLYYATLNTINGVEVNMEGKFVLIASQAGTSLNGNFVSDDFHKYSCAPIKINFQKLPKNAPTLKEQYGVMKPLIIDSTSEEDTIAVVNTLAENKPTTQIQQPPVLPAIAIAVTEAEVKKRTNNYIRILDVADDSVRIDLYDNAEFDYDTLSIFYNSKLVQYRQLLDTKKPISFYVKVDSDETKNDIIMFAENLGLIPPNAALMVVTDSEDRYEVSLESNYTQNAAVRLRKKYKAILRTNANTQ